MNTPMLSGRYYCFCLVIRVNQIEVSPGVNIGHDERFENTIENLIKYREAIHDAIPDARITIAFSHEALTDTSDNFVALREKAREYHLLYGDDITYMLGAYFSGAYSERTAINGHIDEALRLLRAFLGEDYLPASIVGGFVPASAMEHIASLGIRAVQGIIFSQYAVDNQDGDGSLCYPYYPSKEHFCKPAQNESDLIDVVVLDGWTVEFVCATLTGYIPGGYNSRMGCGPIESIGAYGETVGIDIMMKTAAQMYEESYAMNGGFGYACSIWELCLIQQDGHHQMNMDEGAVRKFFTALKAAYPDVKVVTYGELADDFRNAHRDNAGISYAFDHQGIGIGGSDGNTRIEWYMNGLFRMALRTDLTTGERRVIDFTDYTKPAAEPADSNYQAGIVHRNWSQMGDINQKGLRPQDAPVPLDALNERQKDLIRTAEEKFGLKIL